MLYLTHSCTGEELFQPVIDHGDAIPPRVVLSRIPIFVRISSREIEGKKEKSILLDDERDGNDMRRRAKKLLYFCKE